jgi:Methyltransferase FkbM domain
MNLRIVRGPFRGGVFYSRPGSSLRKIFGLYEHELNGWLKTVLPQIDRVLDVGANDGYFTFGCAAAMQRMGKPVRIVAFEPVAYHVRQLQQARDKVNLSEASIKIVQANVGRAAGPGVVTLDQFRVESDCCARTLIKIDVEGAELDVITGGMAWLVPTNFFLIEIHSCDGLVAIRKMFSKACLNLVQINQRPLPLLGRETRVATNWWFVSEL